MRVCKLLFICLNVFIFTGFAYANKCDDGDRICFINEDGYEYLYKDGEKLFEGGHWAENMMESVYTYKINKDRYGINYDSFSSGKHSSYTLFNIDFTDVYSVSMEHGFDQSKLYPDNVYFYMSLCYASNIDLKQYKSDNLNSMFGLACYASSAPKQLSNGSNDLYIEPYRKFVGDDLFFEISYSHDRKRMSPIKAVAFEFLPSLNRYLMACIENCNFIKNKENYLGKLHTYPITMFIRYEGDSVFGEYYYNKYKQNINFEGTRQGDELTLFVKNEQGEVTEKFIGVLDDGSFAGQWFNMKNKEVIKALQFQTYVRFSVN